MTKRMIFALLLVSAAAGPAAAQDTQQRGGIRTETMNRIAGRDNYDIIWNAIGLLGLLGLLGFERKHNEDSYHPAPLD